MKDLAPDIFRQRLLIEGTATVAPTRESLAETMRALAAHLGLRAYAEPVIFSPGGAGRDDNQGFDAFLPLVDSGISVYYWSTQRFVSVLLYTCKAFDAERATGFVRERFGITGEIAVRAF